MGTEPRYKFEIPEQGINALLTKEAALKFFDEGWRFFRVLALSLAGISKLVTLTGAKHGWA